MLKKSSHRVDLGVYNNDEECEHGWGCGCPKGWDHARSG